MLGTTAIDGMGGDEILTLAGERAETIRTAEADLLRIAYQWAVLHSPDRTTSPDRPGREKARLYGGTGPRWSRSSRPRSSGSAGTEGPQPADL